MKKTVLASVAVLVVFAIGIAWIALETPDIAMSVSDKSVKNCGRVETASSELKNCADKTAVVLAASGKECGQKSIQTGRTVTAAGKSCGEARTVMASSQKACSDKTAVLTASEEKICPETGEVLAARSQE